MAIRGERQSRNDEDSEITEAKLNIEDINIMYTNADSLPNKIQELKSRFCTDSYKPKVISITEVKHKHKWNVQLSELNIDGYDLFSNDLSDNNRGILTYVSKDVACKQIYAENTFQEYVWLEITVQNNFKLYIGTFYRSPSSSPDNDEILLGSITKLCSTFMGHVILLGDFNWPDIDWSNYTASHRYSTEAKFLDILHKNFLLQHVNKPTRARGTDTPNILDLVISDGTVINNVNFLSPLGNSDHSVLLIDGNLKLDARVRSDRFNFSKGDYGSLRHSLCLDWGELMLPHSNDIEKMWEIFKREILEKVQQYIPKINNFSSWKKDSWVRPLDKSLRKKITSKNRLWTRYIETRDPEIHKKYKKIRNEIRRETRNIEKRQQLEVALQSRENPKKFWNYVNSKRKLKSNVGDLKNVDTYGNTTLLTKDEEKANALGNFFSSVFTDEATANIPATYDRLSSSPIKHIEVDEDIILNKLSKLDVTKSPGPDGLHPRILYEIRNEIVFPLLN